MILCCCAGGSVRSYTLARILRHERRIKDVFEIPISEQNVTPEIHHWFYSKADLIIVTGEAELLARIPQEYSHKIIHFDVGLDTYGVQMNEELKTKYYDMLDRTNPDSVRQRLGW